MAYVSHPNSNLNRTDGKSVEEHLKLNSFLLHNYSLSMIFFLMLSFRPVSDYPEG